MADNYLSGKTGYVSVAPGTNVDYATGIGTAGTAILMSFGDWRLPMEAATPEITNFNCYDTSTGQLFRAFVPGAIGATVETDCPGYNQGNMPLMCGNPYFLVLGYNASVSIPVTAILKKLEPANKADGVPTVKASWQVTGIFQPYIT